MAKEITRKTPQIGRPALTVAEQRSLISGRSKEFDIQGVFKYGYRNKEDVSNLPPSVLVVGSQNVLTNAAELLAIRQGYTLDGPAGTQNDYGIDSSYDFQTRLGNVQNLRKWGTNLEVRFPNDLDYGPELLVNGSFNGSADGWSVILDGSLLTLPNGGWSYGTHNAQYTAPDNGSLTQLLNLIEDVTYRVQFVVGGTAGSVKIGMNNAEMVSGITPGTTVDMQITAPQNDGNIFDGSFRIAQTTDFDGTISSVSVRKVGGDTQWINILATLDVLYPVNFTSFWDLETEVKSQCLFVNHSSLIYEWSGGVATFASATADSITVEGDVVINNLNFYTNASNSSKFTLTINQQTYTYTGVTGNTFTGVTPDPSLAGIDVGDPIVQTPNSSNPTGSNGFPAGFIFDLISTLENQVWYGSFANNTLLVSKTNNYLDTTYTTPVRLPSEGANITLDAYPVGFSPQATQMYITAGQDQWWVSQKLDQTIDVSGVAVATQALFASRLKTALNQAAQSQTLIGRYKNSLVFVSNEPIINALGLIKNINDEPQIVNISDPIKFDVDAYDFTGGDVEYDNYYIYVSAPANGVVRMYNVQKQYWEAPQTMPIGKFYHISSSESGNLFGHSNLTNESYQLFTGTSDNGNPINFVAALPYVSDQAGAPFQLKSFNKIYTEGYIAANTTLMVTVNYDFGGFSGSYTTIIDGSETAILFNRITDGSLGHNSLGSQPIGTILNLPFETVVPKFRIINTMPRVNFFEYQIVYATQDDDANVTLLRFGPAIEAAQAMPNSITF